MMSSPPIIGKLVSLHSKSKSDASHEYIWKKDAELAALNGQLPLNDSFEQYLTNLKTAQDDPLSHKWFSIKTLSDKQYIGYCTIYNIDWDATEAHVGITIGDRRYWGQGYGEDSIKTLANHAFHCLGMHRLHLKTLERNARAQKCFQKCGFKPCGSILERANTYILMQLRIQDYVK
ncbi:MAG: GNAT family N-acetyltransferase [Dehalococcoidia bacterium]|nr:GNAT family N-acetyltransferase [Dehalococcoidia bacterium]